MKGRSLWSALMLAWLSATNTPGLPEEPMIANVSVSEQEITAETAILSDADSSEATMGMPASRDAMLTAEKSSR